jgi:hypothetical protein
VASGEDYETGVDDWFEEEYDEHPAPRRRPTGPRSSGPRHGGGGPPPWLPGTPVLVGAGLVLLVLVIAVVAFTGNGETVEAPPAEEVPTEPVEPEPGEPGEEALEPPAPLPTETTIRQGDEGASVTALQQALAQLGYEPGEPDGNYGPQTVEAVRRFQTDAGLQADGIAGPITLQAINDRLAEQG